MHFFPLDGVPGRVGRLCFTGMQNFPLDWIRRDEWGLLGRGEAKAPKPRSIRREMDVVQCAVEGGAF